MGLCVLPPLSVCICRQMHLVLLKQRAHVVFMKARWWVTVTEVNLTSCRNVLWRKLTVFWLPPLFFPIRLKSCDNIFNHVAVVLHIGVIWVPGITEKALLFSLENKTSRIKDTFSLFSKDQVDAHVFMWLQALAWSEITEGIQGRTGSFRDWGSLEEEHSLHHWWFFLPFLHICWHLGGVARSSSQVQLCKWKARLDPAKCKWPGLTPPPEPLPVPSVGSVEWEKLKKDAELGGQ